MQSSHSNRSTKQSRLRRLKTERLEDRRMLAVASLVADLATESTVDHLSVATIGNQAYFSDPTTNSGSLWKLTSGSTTATVLDRALVGPWLPQAQHLTAVEDRLFYTTEFGGLGVYDPATSQLRYFSFLFDDLSETASLSNVGGEVFRFKESSTREVTLFAYDGLSNVPREMGAFDFGGSVRMLPKSTDTHFFFRSSLGSDGELWSSDGTVEGTQPIQTLIDNATPNNSDHYAAVGSKLFYVKASVAESGSELSVTDGTAEGTQTIPLESGDRIQKISSLGDHTLLVSVLQTNNSYAIRRIDTNTLQMVSMGFELYGKAISVFSGSSAVVFQTLDLAFQRYLVISDGTSTGTSTPIPLLDDYSVLSVVESGSEGEFLVRLRQSGSSAGESFLLGQDGLVPIVAQPISSNPENLRSVGEQLVFKAQDQTNRSQLWSIPDGLQQPIPLTQFDRVTRIIFIDNPDIADVMQERYFVVSQPWISPSLWVTDGTMNGTHEVLTELGASLWPQSQINYESFQARFQGQLVFTTTQDTWITDGTPAGTSVFSERYPSLEPPVATLNVGDKTFWVDTQDRLFVSTGGLAESTQIDDTISVELRATGLIRFQNGIAFARNERRLDSFWFSDGTSTGTYPFDIDPHLFRIFLGQPVESSNGLFYFDHVSIRVGDDIVNSKRIMLASGNQNEGVVLKVLNSNESFNGTFQILNNQAHFRITRQIPGERSQIQWWTSDGTASGTQMIFDSTLVRSGEGVVFDNRIYFAGWTEELGTELWSTDGTVEGTVPATNLRFGNDAYASSYLEDPVDLSSLPDQLTVHAGELFFTAMGDGIGQELYKISPAAPSLTGVDVNSGSTQRSTVNHVDLQFDSAVQFPIEAITLHLDESVEALPVQIEVLLRGTTSLVRLTPDAGTRLPDGPLRVRLDTSQIKSTGRAAGTDITTLTSSTIDGFFQKYGDADGDGVVGLSDFASFRSVFGNSVDESNDLGLDANRDGIVTLTDFAAFRAAFGS